MNSNQLLGKKVNLTIRKGLRKHKTRKLKGKIIRIIAEDSQYIKILLQTDFRILELRVEKNFIEVLE